MKKIFTLMAAACLGVSSLSALSLPSFPNAEGLTIAPQTYKNLEAASKRALEASKAGDASVETISRSIVNPADGCIYNLQMLTTGDAMCDIFVFYDQAGNEKHYTFDEWPMYFAQYYLIGYPDEYSNYETLFTFYVNWPSKYIYSQIFDESAYVDDEIPVENRDYSIVTATELMNNPDGCRTFKEASPFYFTGDMTNTGWACWYMFPNYLMENPAYYKGEEGYTHCEYSEDGVGYSYVSFSGYDAATNDVSAYNVMQFSAGIENVDGVNGTTGRVTNFRLQYDGEARVEGFEPVYANNKGFGEMHIFNTGLFSSDSKGMDGVFTGGDWGPYTTLYYLAFDDHLEFVIDPSASKFDTDAFGVRYKEDSGSDSKYASLARGYIFLDPKYGEDTNLDVTEGVFEMEAGELAKDLDGSTYTKISPVENCWVSGGYNTLWSQTFGSRFFYSNQPQYPSSGVIQWGTVEGYVLEASTDFDIHMRYSSDKDIVYHYDPLDIMKVRYYTSVGTNDVVGVAEVPAEKAASVVAANGVITVVAVENAPVAVYSLDGACVKTVNAVAGEAVNVPVNKGVYVVVVGKEASKVVL